LDVIRARIESLKEHAVLLFGEEMSMKGDLIGLLLTIKGIVYNFQIEKYRPMAIHKAMQRFYLIYQDRYSTYAQEHTSRSSRIALRCWNTVEVSSAICQD
jgi:hypothetical protein